MLADLESTPVLTGATFIYIIVLFTSAALRSTFSAARSPRLHTWCFGGFRITVLFTNWPGLLVWS